MQNRFDEANGTFDLGALEPLHFLQVVKPKACSSVSAFAVDHHGDDVELVGRWCGKWKNTTIPVQRQSENRP